MLSKKEINTIIKKLLKLDDNGLLIMNSNATALLSYQEMNDTPEPKEDKVS